MLLTMENILWISLSWLLGCYDLMSCIDGRYQQHNQWPTSEANIKQDWLELKTPTVEKKKGDGEGNKEITAHKLEILLNKSKWYKNERKNVLICTVFKKPTICISKSRDLEHIFPQFVHQFCIHYVACNPGSLDCGLQKRTSRQRSTIKPVNCFSNNYWPLGEHNWNIYIFLASWFTVETVL